MSPMSDYNVTPFSWLNTYDFKSLFEKMSFTSDEIEALDFDYGVRSGNKCASAFTILGSEKLDFSQKFSSIMKSKFIKKWEGLYDTLALDYDALSPYMMSVEDDTTTDSTNTKSGERSHEGEDSRTVSDTRVITGTKTNNTTEDVDDTETISASKSEDSQTDSNETMNKQVYGFNSTNPVDSEKDTKTIAGEVQTSGTSESTSSRTSGKTHNESITENENVDSDITDSNTSSATTTDSSTENIESVVNRKIVRKGNTGNITMQELIRQQRELVKFNIIEVMCDDIDSVLTRARYVYYL